MAYNTKKANWKTILKWVAGIVLGVFLLNKLGVIAKIKGMFSKSTTTNTAAAGRYARR